MTKEPPLVEALFNVWEYGKGPSFVVAYKGVVWIATGGSTSVGSLEEYLEIRNE